MSERRATVIRGGRVLDPVGPRGEPMDVLVRGDEVVEVGPPGLAAPDGAAVLDATGKLLHPGLINAHMHGHGSLAKGMGDRWTLELLLTAGPWLGGNRGLEEKALSSRLSAAEMVLKGCTACYDLYFEWPAPSPDGLAAVAEAYRAVGMRAVLAPMVADRTFFEAIPGLAEALGEGLGREVERLALAPAGTTLEAMAAVLRDADGGDKLVRPAVAPTIPLHCSREFLESCVALAREHDVGLHSHIAESKAQAISSLKTFGKTIIAFMDELGALGPHFTAAHGVWLDDDDMRRLGDHGASVSHNPGSNMRLGSGLADARGMLERNVNLAIGTDGAQCSDNLNMYEAMHLASLVSKVQGPEYARWLTTDEVFAAATTGSARALGLGDRLGRIAPGYKADIVFLDLGHINWSPLNDAVNQLVHTEDSGAVESVMVGGEMVVEERRLTRVDLAKLSAEAEDARERLVALNADNKALYERLEDVVGAYCVGLAKGPYHVHRYGASNLA
jgi:guanine deaminase